VLLEGAAEVVAAVILGDKVEKILLCGIERSLKRLSSWITDWWTLCSHCPRNGKSGA